MPQPTVEVSTFPESGPFYAGSGLSLRCTIEIDSVVDVPYIVIIEWLKLGEMLSSNEYVSVSNITQLSSYLYEASVNLSPLSITSDTGIYTCQVTIDPNPPLLYVQMAMHFDTETVSIQSK